MQIIRFFPTIAFFVAIGISSACQGQILGKPGQLAQQPLGGSPYTSSPEAAVFDPGNLDYDMQVFAPLDISEFDGATPVAGGFYASYDRTYTSVRQPRPWGGGVATRLTAFPRGSDFQSGNLFPLGNMGDNGAGWDGKYFKSSGSTFNAATNPATPRLTVTSLHFLEFNRAFRQPLSRGGFIEPYFGIRYRYFQDRSNESTAQNFFDATGAIVAGNLVNVQTARNSIIGGGVGFRLYQRSGRWQWMFDAGLDGGFNTQSFLINESYDSTTANLGSFALNRSASTFTPNADLSTELTYQLTRDVSIKAGGQMSFMWGGVTRADTRASLFNASSSASRQTIAPTAPFLALTPPPGVRASNQGVMIAGFTLGVEWRR